MGCLPHPILGERAVVRLGIPDLEAKVYACKLKEGKLLIYAHTENSDEIQQAREIFTNCGVQNICTTSEAATPKNHELAKTPAMADYAGDLKSNDRTEP